jgi:hypothetical protein
MQLHAWAGWPGSASGMQCGVEYSWWTLRGWPHSAHLSSGLFASVIVTNSKAVYVPPDWYEGPDGLVREKPPATLGHSTLEARLASLFEVGSVRRKVLVEATPIGPNGRCCARTRWSTRWTGTSRCASGLGCRAMLTSRQPSRSRSAPQTRT